MSLLSIEGLGIAAGRPLVSDLWLTVEPGQRLGLIGESGSGKSLTALAILGLVPRPLTTQGRVVLGGTDMLSAPEPERVAHRGRTAALVFQEPSTALDPLMRVGRQVSGPLGLHQGLEGSAAVAEVVRLFDRVKLPRPRDLLSRYPHQLSGGQRQRVALAQTLACRPRLLVADEPTTALDVTVQADILALLAGIVRDEGMALMFITHDIPVVASLVDTLAVMKDGRLVEHGTLDRLLVSPSHEYTRALLDAARRSVEALP